MTDYSKHYSEGSLWEKIKKVAKKAGIKAIYYVLILFLTLQKKETPAWAKTVIIGALGYFILPFDLVPDLIVPVGYLDDIGVLASALASVAFFIDDEIKQNAKNKLHDWFGDFDAENLDENFVKDTQK